MGQMKLYFTEKVYGSRISAVLALPLPPMNIETIFFD